MIVNSVFNPYFSTSYTPLSGFYGVLSGLLVGVKQITPDQELPLLRIKAKVRMIIYLGNSCPSVVTLIIIVVPQYRIWLS